MCDNGLVDTIIAAARDLHVPLMPHHVAISRAEAICARIDAALRVAIPGTRSSSVS
jgi:hypothetical protein